MGTQWAPLLSVLLCDLQRGVLCCYLCGLSGAALDCGDANAQPDTVAAQCSCPPDDANEDR